MSLDERMLRQALYCAGEELRARQRGKDNGPKDWNHALIRALERELTMSRRRQSDVITEADSEHEEWIGTAEAAAILGWPTRKVQRRKNEFEWQSVCRGNQLIFNAETVRARAEAALNDG